MPSVYIEIKPSGLRVFNTKVPGSKKKMLFSCSQVFGWYDPAMLIIAASFYHLPTVNLSQASRHKKSTYDKINKIDIDYYLRIVFGILKKIVYLKKVVKVTNKLYSNFFYFYFYPIFL